MSTTNDTRIQQEILTFWFGNEPLAPLAHADKWFTRSDAFDTEIRKRFELHLEQARRGVYAHWPHSPEGRLAYIILLDQFSRNLYRGEHASFTQDAEALQVCESGLAEGAHMRLPPIKRWFFYLPLMHSESLQAQERCMALLKELAAGAPEAVHDALVNAYDYAVKHRDVIAQFGRFPHRNAVLGRENTPAETEYLKDPNAGF